MIISNLSKIKNKNYKKNMVITKIGNRNKEKEPRDKKN